MSESDERPPAHVRLGNRALVVVEDAVYVSIAVLLAVGAAVLVVRAGFTLARGAADSSPDAFIDTLDAILLVFIFVMTGMVYATQHWSNPHIANYADALYFTITSLTTTGFGDITLPGTTGRMLSVVIMLAGVTLFLRLAQAMFRPSKVRHECPSCGLMRHEPDAVHCKACGVVLHICDEGH